MYAVGRLGSYISRGVYTVSAPFHPFGGAVDIVVVEQQDGSFKSSPWYVRFGKFQGVLKAKERAVDINVNGEDVDFSMYLDHTGEAYFLREVDIEEGDLLLSHTSSGEEMDELERRPMKCNSWNEGVNSSVSVTQLEVSNGKVVARSGSRRSRLMGLVFGRNSVKDSKSEDDKDAADVIRAEALESAEFAADLLEVKWSTNLGSFKKDKDNISRLSAPDILNGVASKDFLIDEDSCLLDRGVTKLENRTFRRQPTVYYETLETSKIDSDDYGEQDNDTVDLSCVKSGGASVQEEISSDPESSTDAISKVEVVHVPGVLVDGTSCKFIGDRKTHESEGAASQNDRVLTETSSEPVTVEQTDDSPKTVDSSSTLTISSSSDPISSVQDEKGVEKEFEMKRPLAKPFYDSKEVSSEFVRSEEMNNSSSVGLDEEQFLFSDLDNFKVRQDRCVELIPIDLLDKQNYSSLTSEGIESVSGSSPSEFESPVKFTQENLPVDDEESSEETNAISSQLEIPRINKFAGQELGTMVESLPNMCSQFDELDGLFTHHPLGHSLDSSPKSSEWASLRKNYKRSIKSDAGSTHNLSHLQCIKSDALNLEELKIAETSPAAGNFSKAVENSSSGRWDNWPFKRSSSMKDTQSAANCTRSIDAEISLESTSGMDGEKEVRMGEVPDKEVPDVVSNKEVPNNDVSEKEVYDTEVPDKELPKPKAYRQLIRVRYPTTEQLASLNLKEGRNIVTFTFATAMLGKQQVDARIYLWRWDTRIVITDVDGTITKSDVLGQFMPLVGKDWSQTGVAHLFSAIKENGYQLLFLSARAISQASNTRQFLFNLKQDGKSLPEGPVVISPDGLFPSLFREVIRRAPHEFKIACLEDIKACFPSDRNPFYAGFGNRDTDEFSYLKVGIPKGKIFIINPKGEVVVNRCDNKSYTSLHALVNGMFPPTLSSEQEDFNSWNFWKLPPPLIDL